MKASGKVFVVDDDRLVANTLNRALSKVGFQVRTAYDAVRLADRIDTWSPDVVLLDIHLPDGNGIDILNSLTERGTDTQVIMLTADGTAETAIQAMKAGAADYLTKPFDIEEVRLVVHRLVEKQRLKREVILRRRVQGESGVDGLIGSSRPMRLLANSIGKLVEAQVGTILITGESGTGKELVARHIDAALGEMGDLSFRPFIAVNCTAIPENLIESELFGHARGSFTDAKKDKKGLFQLAEGGTLLLDEIGDMPLPLQGKLLRVLEERTFRRVGGKDEIDLGCAVIASTNRDLPQLVEADLFRRDLYFRLNTFGLQVPPLRERGGDILELAHHFLRDFCVKYGRKGVAGISDGAAAALSSYAWPGNVRELRNVIERIVVLEAGARVDLQHLPSEIRGKPAGEAAAEAAPAAAGHYFLLPPEGVSLEDVKRDLIEQALKQSDNNRVRAAKLLGISYETLRYQLKRHGLS